MRITMKKWMLGTALAVGLLGTGAVAANAAPREFGGRGTVRPEPVVGRGFERAPARGFDRGYVRGYERPVVRGYGYGIAVGVPYAEAYIPPCPGDGYIWLNGAWVFRGGPGFVRGYGYGRGFDRGFVAGRDRGFDRGGDRGGHGLEHGRR